MKMIAPKTYTVSRPRMKSPKSERMYDGKLFASKAEMKRWIFLCQLEREGKIRNLQRQVNYKLILPNGVPIRVGRKQQVARFTLDHEYEVPAGNDADGAQKWTTIYEDVKGFMTPEVRLRLGVFEAIYGFKVTVVTK